MENRSENETAPLLERDHHGQTEAPTPAERLHWYQLGRPWHIGLLILFSATLWNLSVAILRLYTFSNDLFVEPDFVRLNDVLHYVCRLLVAIPFGILADRARKPVFILASAGQILSIVWLLFVAIMQPTLPRELQLLGALGQLVGGGMLLVNVTHVTVMADVLPPEQRLLGFLLLLLLQQPIVLIATPLVDPLRRLYSPLPLVLSLVLALLGASLVVFLPETMRGSRSPRTEQVEVGPWSRARSCLHLRFRDVGPALAVARSPNVLWILLAFATLTLAANGYWLADFAYLWAPGGLGQENAPELSQLSFITRCVTLGLLLPALGIMLVHPNGHARFTGFQRDLLLTRISTIFAVAGVLLTFGPAKSLLVVGTIAFGLSAGLHPLCLSLISRVTPTSGYATIYSLVSAVSTLVAIALAPFYYGTIAPPRSSWTVLIEVVILTLLYLVVLAALFQLKVRSAGPGSFAEAQPEGVRGDGGSVLVNDEDQV